MTPVPRPAPREARARSACAGLGLRVDPAVQELVQLLGANAAKRLVPSDESLVRHLDGHADRRGPVALAGARLQHPQRAVLDRELDVLHVPEVLSRTPRMRTSSA
jgi:hypothetical protein